MSDLDLLGLLGARVSVSRSSFINKHFIPYRRAVYFLILFNEVDFPFAITIVNFLLFSN
jgi:hypothetical protein